MPLNGEVVGYQCWGCGWQGSHTFECSCPNCFATDYIEPIYGAVTQQDTESTDIDPRSGIGSSVSEEY